MATAPPALSAVPEFPALSNRSTYNALAYAFGTGMRVTFAPELVALAANVYSNAVDAYDNASATASDRLQTTADVNQAEIYKDQAASERGTAQAAAVSAAASAVLAEDYAGSAGASRLDAEFWASSASASAATAAGGSFRNRIINGGFDIWQRGASGFTANQFNADRWQFLTDGTVTVSQQSFTPGATDSIGTGAPYYLRITRGGTGTYGLFVTRIEDVRTLGAQVCTISFWAKADAATTFNVGVSQLFGLGGSPSTYLSAGSVTLTTSWQRYTKTITVPSIAYATIGTTNSLEIRIIDGTTLGRTIDIWGVQLEPGTVVTPFEARPIGIERNLCKRFYKSLAANTAYTCISPLAVAINATDIQVDLGPADMRVTPTLSALTAANTIFYGIGVSPSSFSGLSASAGRYTMTAYSTGLTTGKASMWQQNSTPGGVAALSAEL